MDGGDLLGVFDRDASAGDAHGDARSRRAADASADAAADAGGEAAAPEAPRARPAPGTSCVASEGLPNRDLSRTVGRPACRDAQILEWRDAEGSPRYACVFAPKGVETRAPLPLLIFFHDGLDDPTSVGKKTGLHKLGAQTNLTGDPAHAGFIVLAPQGRAIRGGKQGTVFDTDYTGADSVDLAAVDHFYDELAGKGLVDPRRVYTLGASYGGQMAATYAMARADRVAAFATYGADSPRGSWSCAGPPPPALVLYRACDTPFPCESVERWLRARDALGAETDWMRLGAGNEDEPNCAVRNRCSALKGTANHRRWPKQREAEILAFLGRHTLGP
jgi:poly(3-hydroxybutyrate) depolymerase